MLHITHIFFLPGFLGSLLGGVGIFLLIPYFLPTIIALLRRKPNAGGILLLNFFLGWTFIGWIVALVWAVSGDTGQQQVIINNQIPLQERKEPTIVVNPAPYVQMAPQDNTRKRSQEALSSLAEQDRVSRLRQLKELLDEGVLTQEEFNQQKARILAM
jgi:hypothetical protein